MARGPGDKLLRQRREKRLAVVLANSCRMSRARRLGGGASGGGLLALAVPVLLFILGLLAVAGVLREYWI